MGIVHACRCVCYCVYVCLYIYSSTVHACVYVHVYMLICVCIGICVCTCEFICVYMCKYLCIPVLCVHVCKCVYVCECGYRCTRVYECACTCVSVGRSPRVCYRGEELRVSAGQWRRALPSLCQRLPGCGKVRVSPGLLPENSGAAL